ncbi:MAG: precorrin-8X methylmutase [Alphaproteobacteria bacterium]|nr:precorrin-8X methylmutase [Alphaproteobacteria bacterium]
MNHSAIIPPYCRNPDEIYRESFQTIDALIDSSVFPKNLYRVIQRLAHAVGRVEIADSVYYSNGWHDDDFIDRLQQAKFIFTDSEMTRAGMITKNLPVNLQVKCTLNHPDCASLALQHNTTRSAAAVDLWQATPNTAIAVIGNAPTALFRLLENIQAGKILPLLIIAFPVGFIGAAESKNCLIEQSDKWDVEWLAIKGREGGSALAAAAINALFAPVSSK